MVKTVKFKEVTDLNTLLEKVAEIFLAMSPDLPIPAKITLPLQFNIASHACTKDLSKILLIFLSSVILAFGQRRCN